MIIAIAQHLLKGLVAGGGSSGWIGVPQSYIYKEMHQTAGQMQMLQAASNSPWSLKPLFGLVSDLWPLGGYRKKYYILGVTVLAIPAYLVVWLGFSNFSWIDLKPNAANTTICFFLMFLQIAVVDLLVEAQYAERIRHHPNQGPSLITFVSTGLVACSMLSTVLAGFAVEYLPFGWIYFASLLLIFPIIPPTWHNWLGEGVITKPQAEPDEEKAKEEEEGKAKRGYIWFSVLLSVVAIGTALLGVLKVRLEITVAMVLLSIVLVIVALFQTVAPVVAKAASFFFLQNVMGLRIDGAAFLFYTDTQEQYPEGPHFSPTFYITILGVVSGVFSLLGVAIYHRFLARIRYRQLFVIGNLISFVLGLSGIVVFGRWNLTMGMPDNWFVMGSGAIQQSMAMLTWMPSTIMISQLCPPRYEACTYAIVAGVMNLGTNMAQYLGAYLLQLLHVAPAGSKNESLQFTNLWLAALIASIFPCLVLLLVTRLIPDASPSQSLIIKEEKKEKEEKQKTEALALN